MTQDKKDFIEAMLTWFRSPKVGKDEEIDREFLSDAYDSIACPHWISVEDELPPKDKAYLAYWQHLGVTKYRYVKAGAKNIKDIILLNPTLKGVISLKGYGKRRRNNNRRIQVL